MPTEASNIYIPELNPNNFDQNTRMGRFGKGVAGFGPNRGLSGLHRAGMGVGNRFFGVYPALGLGPDGLLDFSSYSMGSGRTLGEVGKLTAAGRGTMGFRAQASQYGKIASNVMKRGSAGQRSALGFSAATRMISPALLGYSIYQGYKDGGIGGAAKAGAGHLAVDYAISAGLKAAGALGTPLAIADGVAAVGYGSYKLLKAGNARMKRVRNMEMGGPINDPFGNGATMRQRSLQALQGSQLNGRSAFGSEAMLLHVPMFR